MNAENEKLERLKDYLSKFPLLFCLVYRGKETKAGVELKWCKAVSPDKKSHAEYDELAAKYQEVAAHCYEHGRNLILKENLPRANSTSQRWCGLNIPTGTNENPTSANSLGQRWWHLVVGSGATRDAGYVIVTRIGAKVSKELHELIAGIEEVWQG